MTGGVIPKVSVVTAAYKALGPLRETVASVAGQGVEDVEHVVVDGGSNDGTREYLESCEGVRWVSERDKGIADALNKGVAMARGEWIIVLQAGDTFLEEESLATALPQLDDHAMVGFAVRFVQPDGTARIIRPHPLGVGTELRVLNPHQGLFCHRRVFDAIGGFDTAIPIGMDYDHMLRAKHAGFDLKVVDKVLSIMPADGVSSQSDWAGRSQRMREQFRIQWKNAPHVLHKAGLLGFWALFYPAYGLKYLVAPQRRFY